jgi:tRNA U38,U39,U40 pseudouridine synthase TruA
VKNYKWGRAARTDKGVHAIINGVSCLFIIPQTFYDETKTLQQNKLLMKLK